MSESSTGTPKLQENSLLCVVNRFNMVENADFACTTSNMPNNWTASGLTGNDVVLTTADSTNPPTNHDNRMIFYGDPSSDKQITQNLYQAGQAGDSYVVGAWAKATSVSLNSGLDREFNVSVCFDYTNPSYSDEWVPVTFSEDSQIWQYACGAVVAKYEYQNMTIRAQYRNNANTAEFDAIQLFKEEFGSTYVYDDAGNLVKVTDAPHINSSNANLLANGNAEEAVGWEFYSYGVEQQDKETRRRRNTNTKRTRNTSRKDSDSHNAGPEQIKITGSAQQERKSRHRACFLEIAV